MAKVFHVRAPTTVSLHKMDEKDIHKLVAEEVDKVMAHFPPSARPVGVSMVNVSQLPAGADGWAEWTRACCGKGNQIDEYVDPTPEEIENAGRDYRPQRAHIESSFTVQTIANPVMHGPGAKTGP